MAKVHQIVPVVARRSILCPVALCGSQFPYQGPLRAHLKDAHDITLEDIEISFLSMNEFFEWKRREEETFSLKYVKACGTQRLMDGIEVYRFNCFRSGMYSPEGKGLRRMKAQGSCKIGASCPSTITVHCKPDGNVTCSYCMTHVGHDLNTSSESRRVVRLSSSGEASNKFKLASNSAIPNETSDGKPSKVTYAMVKNYQLFSDFNLSTEDRLTICNAISKYQSVDEMFDYVRKCVNGKMDAEYEIFMSNLKRMNNHIVFNDMSTDFQQLTEQCNALEETPVVFYEGLVSDSDGEATDTFILVVMNSIQVELLKSFGHQGLICIDPVYSADEMGYVAIALYVLSSQSEWLLCSVCFCQTFNYVTMKSYFSQIHTRTGPISVKTIITEDNDSISAAWLNVMGGGLEWITAPWHVDHKLRAKLKSLVFTDYAKLACLYRLVRCLMETTSEEKFNENLSFLSKQAHNNPPMANFHKFLHDTYIWRKYNWAKYCRNEKERNALSSAEAVHLLAQRVCHGEDLNLGQTLFTIFQYYRVKCLSSLAVSRAGDGNLEIGQITCPDLNALGDVFVSSSAGQKVRTLQIGDTAVDVAPTGNSCLMLCPNRCGDCNMCIHRYKCSCMESVIQWRFCKHLHLIGHHLINTGEVDDDIDDEDVEEETFIDEDDDAISTYEATNTESSENQPNVDENSACSINSDQDLKSKVLGNMVLEVEKVGQEINNCARNIQRIDDLVHVQNALKAALVIAQSFLTTEDAPTDGILLKLASLEDHNYTL
ncbi:hypothetical protein CHUAL_014009 [Chamberlinius hualienensis]